MKPIIIRYLRLSIHPLLLVSFLVLLAPLPAARAAPPSQTPDATLRIVNESKQTICYILIVTVTDTTGENAILSDDALEPGEETTFTLSVDDYHIGLLDCNQDILLAERNVSLIGTYELRFTSPDLCKSLNQEGEALYHQAQYRDALQQFQKALACYQEVGDQIEEWGSLNNIGLIYSSLAACRSESGVSANALETKPLPLEH